MIEALPSGGAERQLVQLMNELARQGNAIFLITWVNQDFYTQQDIPEVRWSRIERKSRFDFSPIRAATHLIRKHQISVIQGFLDTGNLYAVLAGLLSGQGGAIFCSERSAERNMSFYTRLHKWFSHRISAGTITNSEIGKQFVRKFRVRENQIHVVRNAFQAARFQVASEEERYACREKLGFKREFRYGLCVARLSPVKNHMGILHALAAINLPPDFRMVFVGNGEPGYCEELTEMTESLALSTQVEFRDATEEIEQYYKAADFFVLFSNYEGSANTPIEAMLAGLPIIISDTGGLQTYISEGVSLVKPGDIEALTASLKYMITCPEAHLRELGRIGAEHVCNQIMSVENTAIAYLNIYKQSLGG